MPKGYPSPFVDLSTTRFGSWTVVSFSRHDPKRRRVWLCRCDCGKTSTVIEYRLMNGESRACRSCGLVERGKVKDLVGQEIGCWTVLAFHHSGPEYSRFWTARCGCGNVTIVAGKTLDHNPTVGCRTCVAERRVKNPLGILWAQIKHSARVRNIPFEIDRDFAWDLLQSQAGRCALSGLPIRVARTKKIYSVAGCTASLDRIDSSRGYTRDNVQWVHKDINRIKMDLSDERFVELCKAVARHSRKKLNPAPAAEELSLFS